MKNNLLAIGLVVAMFSAFAATPVEKPSNLAYADEQVNATVVEFHPKIIAAFEAAEKKYLDNDPTPPTPDDDLKPHPDPAKCPCKGTGRITHGDGHSTPCPYHGNKAFQEFERGNQKWETFLGGSTFCNPGACPCGGVCDCDGINTCSGAKAITVVKPEPKPEVIVKPKPKPEIRKVRKDRPRNTGDKVSYQLMVMTASWCTPCNEMKKDLNKAFANTDIILGRGPEADIRYLDVDEFPTFYKKYKGSHDSLPLFIEVKDGKILSRSPAVKSARQIIDQYDLEK